MSYESDTEVDVHYQRTGLVSRRWAGVITSALLVVLLVVAGIVGIAEIMKKGERAECLAWKEQASHNSIFYLVGWQSDQCKSVGVPMKGISVRR